jgi:hypothetical protein
MYSLSYLQDRATTSQIPFTGPTHLHITDDQRPRNLWQIHTCYLFVRRLWSRLTDEIIATDPITSYNEQHPTLVHCYSDIHIASLPGSCHCWAGMFRQLWLDVNCFPCILRELWTYAEQFSQNCLSKPHRNEPDKLRWRLCPSGETIWPQAIHYVRWQRDVSPDTSSSHQHQKHIYAGPNVRQLLSTINLYLYHVWGEWAPLLSHVHVQICRRFPGHLAGGDMVIGRSGNRGARFGQRWLDPCGILDRLTNNH